MRRLGRTIALALAATAVGCSDGSGPAEGMSRARVLLTDAPFPFDAVRSVDVYVVSIAAATSADTSEGAEWITIAEPRRRFDLLALQGGQAIVIGEGDLPAAQYAAVRLVINTDSSGITLTNGTPATVNWQGAGEKTLYALVEQPLALWEPGTNLDVVLDFDVGRSFLLESASPPPSFLFIPWIRAVNQAATGVIAGTVRGADAPSEVLETVPNASIVAYRYLPGSMGPMPGYVAATGRTDAQGRYAIHYLSAGEYVLEVRPPAGFDAGVALTQTVSVTAGETTVLDVTLPQAGPGGEVIYVGGPATVALGDTGYYYASVFGPGGDSVHNAVVTWFSRNPAVATLEPSGTTARLITTALGSTWVVAALSNVADSMLVTVVQGDTASGGGGPVATVELTPAAQTVSVGDSAGFWATLRNAQGAMLTGRAVTWTASDTTVARFEFVHGQAAILRALKRGTTTVTATSEGKSGTGTVVVQ